MFKEPRKTKYELIEKIGYKQYLIYKHIRNYKNKYNKLKL